MPTYEYKCTNDGSKFELWQEVGSQAPPCPDCGAPSKKVFGPPRVHFKGSGFYLTDLRAEQAGKSGAKIDGAKADGAQTEAAPTSEAKVETSETKAEAKSETKVEAAPASTTAAPPVAAPATK